MVGDLVGMVEAGQYGGVVVLGEFDGSFTSGSDGFILSEGDVLAEMTTGRDLLVWSLGSVLGNYHAGRDATVITYADFDAALTADRDIGHDPFYYYALPGVWARGDIHGTITAGRNIGHRDPYAYAYYDYFDWDGPIFSYGSIDAVITAPNSSGSPDGGHIESVAAWGTIDGRIEASSWVGYVRSGDDVTATILAAQIGPLAENDATIQTQHPYPATPDSVEDEVLAEAAAVYQEVLDDRTLATAAADAAILDYVNSRARALDQLSQEIAAVEAANAQAKADAQESLTKRTAEAKSTLDRQRRDAQNGILALRAEADRQEAALLAEVQRIATERGGALEQANQAKDREGQSIMRASTALTETKCLVVTGSQKERELRQAQFDAMVKQLKEAIARAHSAAQQNGPLGFWGLYSYYFWNRSQMDGDLRIWDGIAFGMIGTGVGGLAGMGAGAGFGALGGWLGSGPLATFIAGGLAGGLVGGEVGGYVGSFGGPLGQFLGSFGGGILGGEGGGQAAASVWSKITGLCNQITMPCFAAGTPLMTPDGAKPIEEFRVGDLVLSSPEDDPAGPVHVCRVYDVMKNPGQVLQLRVGGRTIRVTGQHPFYVKGKEWTPAGLLKPGDLLRSHDGSWNLVQLVSESTEDVVVYNLRVEDYHAYYVGSADWGFSVWAHNSFCNGPSDADAITRWEADLARGARIAKEMAKRGYTRQAIARWLATNSARAEGRMRRMLDGLDDTLPQFPAPWE